MTAPTKPTRTIGAPTVRPTPSSPTDVAATIGQTLGLGATDVPTTTSSGGGASLGTHRASSPTQGPRTAMPANAAARNTKNSSIAPARSLTAMLYATAVPRASR